MTFKLNQFNGSFGTSHRIVSSCFSEAFFKYTFTGGKFDFETLNTHHLSK